MTPFVDLVTKVLAILTLVGDLAVLIVFFALLTKRSVWAKSVLACFKDRLFLFGFVVVLGAVFGSLFYSEVAGFTPCLLCWWQRVLLYPQLILFGFGLWRKDKHIWDYSLVLSVMGALIALYNTYLQFGGSSFLPCPATGPSCAARYFLEYGYITIPTMSLTTFLLLIVLALIYRSRKDDSAGERNSI